MAAPLLFLLGWLWRRRRPAASSLREEQSTPPDVAAPATPLEVARAHRRRLLHAVSARTGLPPESITDEREGVRALRVRGVTAETAHAVVAALADLGARGYAAPGVVPNPASVPDVEALVRRVEAEAVPAGQTDRVTSGRPGHTWRGLLLGGLLLGSGEPVDVNRVVREAEKAFLERRYVVAATLLADAVRQRPTDVDLLVNWGTASWASADTVAAVQGWQRAARLAPLDPEVQQRLRQLPAGAREGLAAVPPYAVPLLALGAAALWLLGWLMAWMALRHPALRAIALALLACSGAAGVSAWRGWRALDATSLWVVVRPETLQAAPMPAADAMGGVGTGDVVEVQRAADGWALVDHADGRRGWLPLPRLTPLLPARGNR
jgi:hypothetical protein